MSQKRAAWRLAWCVLLGAASCRPGARDAGAPVFLDPGTGIVEQSVAREAWRSYAARRTEWVAALADTTVRCVNRSDSRHPIFHGCADWHSAVHAHYALIAAYGVTGRQAYLQPVEAHLKPAMIAAEAAALRGDPGFEMPYGRAWFLRLAIEDVAVTRSERLVATADEVAASIRRFYSTTPPNPAGVDYDNASWALRQLRDYCELRRDEPCVAAVDQWVQRRMLGLPRWGLQGDHEDFAGFLSPWCQRAHLLSVSAPAALGRWVEASPVKPGELLPIREPQSTHQAGMNFSRAWGLFSVYVVLHEPRWLLAAVEHVEAGMHEHPRRADDYREYGHWVPQFGIHAMELMTDNNLPEEAAP